MSRYAGVLRKVSVMLGVLAGALAAAGSAAAVAPTMTVESFHRSIPSFLSCPGFAIHGEFDITRRTTTFYDDAGSPVRIVRHIDSSGTLSNPLTGKTLSDAGTLVITVDLVAGTTSYAGKLRVDTAPGEGVVFQVVGRVVFAPDGTFTGGQFDDPPPGSGLAPDLEALCGYLADP
jgi:hypothetical protein